MSTVNIPPGVKLVSDSGVQPHILEVGADDYVAKPFNPRELLARVGAVLRRTNTLPPRLRGPTAERYRFGEWTFNAAQREIVGPEGLALPLSSGEYKLLMAFLERP